MHFVRVGGKRQVNPKKTNIMSGLKCFGSRSKFLPVCFHRVNEIFSGLGKCFCFPKRLDGK